MFSSHVLYLPAEAGEEDLTELVFVSQLLGNAGEAGAGLRAVSHLRKSKACIIYQKLANATSHNVNVVYLVVSHKLSVTSSASFKPFCHFSSICSRSKLEASGYCYQTQHLT